MGHKLENSGHLDTRFDLSLDKISGLRKKPWIGCNFARSSNRVMILGESNYDWGGHTTRDAQGATVPVPDDLHLRYWHEKFALGARSKKQYARNIEWALWRLKSPDNEARRAIWLQSVYHNLVLDTLPTNKHRPSYIQYVHGWHTALELMRLLSITRVIVYGLESSKRNALKEVCSRESIGTATRSLQENISRSKPRIVRLENNGLATRLFFVRHPSSFFSWRKWGEALKGEDFSAEALFA